MDLNLPRKRVALAIGLLAAVWFAAAVLCAVKAFEASKPQPDGAESIKFDYHGCFLVGGLLGAVGAIVCMATAAHLAARQIKDDAEGRQAVSVAILLSGVVSGSLLLMISLRFFAEDFTILSKWVNQGERAGAWKIVAATLGMILGAGIAFFATVPAKAEERRSESLRRLVYGTSAFVSSLLVLMGLVLVNVLASARLPNMFDTTASGFYTLDEGTKRYLEGLDQEVKVYMLFPDTRSLPRILEDTRWMLNACQEVNADKFRIQEMKHDEKSYETFKTKFKNVKLSAGLLVAVGRDEARYSFIPASELGQETFQGESRLMREVRFLGDDKVKPVIYFTQGHQELVLKASEELKTPARSAVNLVKYLETANFVVKPWKLESGTEKVPDDANLVIIADPAVPFRPEAAAAIQRFLQKKENKLIVLSSPHVSATDGAAMPTGLETVLKEFQIELQRPFLLSDPRFGQYFRPPVIAYATAFAPQNANPSAAFDNPLSNLYPRLAGFPSSRDIRILKGGIPTTAFVPLLITAANSYTWLDNSPEQAVETFAKMMEKNLEAEKIQEAKQFSDSSRLVALGVQDPGTQKGRLVVIGCGQFFADLAYPDPDFKVKPDLPGQTLTVLLDWLRDRPVVATTAKPYESYMPKGKLDTSRLFFFPLGLAVLIIGGLGGAVWLTRRR